MLIDESYMYVTKITLIVINSKKTHSKMFCNLCSKDGTMIYQLQNTEYTSAR